jgi:pyrroline-5-carboxylate reductase
MKQAERVAILGGGNLGSAIARGLAASGTLRPEDITITRRTVALLTALEIEGFRTTEQNLVAVQGCDLVLICVQPQHLNKLLEEIAPALQASSQVVISTVSGASISAMRQQLGAEIPLIRAMPNLGISIGESMTCLAADEPSAAALPLARQIFDEVGISLIIREDQMSPATALCACGIAFFLRAIRAASQGGIEIGFHAEEAIRLAAQTAKGAAALLLAHGSHPETEIDKVTTPEGCTILGLNEMESRGFSSAMVRGIVSSARKAAQLYQPEASGRG